MLFFKDLYAAMTVDAAGYKFLDKWPLRSRWSIVIAAVAYDGADAMLAERSKQ